MGHILVSQCVSAWDSGDPLGLCVGMYSVYVVCSCVLMGCMTERMCQELCETVHDWYVFVWLSGTETLKAKAASV